MSGAGERRERVAFHSIAEDDSSYGIVAGEYAEQFRRAARIKPLLGSEPVLAQRLSGVQPVVIRVTSDSETRDVTTAWKIIDVRAVVSYNVRAVTPDEKRRWIDFLCEAGVAVNG
jgi:head-tail adaptor